MKKSSIVFLLIISLFFFVGCENKNKKNSDDTISHYSDVDTSKMSHKHCTREATAGNDTDVYLTYELYYTGKYLNVLESVEKVVSTSNDTLDTYQNAYQTIHDHYKGLDYYNAFVDRGDTSVTSHIVIDYDHIDIDSLLEIEGEEDNIIVGGKARVDKWLELAKKFGTKCEEVKES